jgi:hypothetical protein
MIQSHNNNVGEDQKMTESFFRAALRRILLGDPDSNSQLALAIGRGIIFAIPIFIASLIIALYYSDHKWVSILLFPLTKLVMTLVGPGHNIGTEEHPFIEGPPIQIIALLIGILLSIIQYICMISGILWWFQNTRRANYALQQAAHKTRRC